MLSKYLRIAILGAAAAAPAAAVAFEPPAPRPEAARETRATPRQAPELICRSVEIAATGDTPMVCMTAADWRRAEQ